MSRQVEHELKAAQEVCGLGLGWFKWENRDHHPVVSMWLVGLAIFLKRNFLSSTSEVIFFGRLDNFFTKCETFSRKKGPLKFFSGLGRGNRLVLGGVGLSRHACFFFFPQVNYKAYMLNLFPNCTNICFVFFPPCLSGMSFWNFFRSLKFEIYTPEN